MLVIGLFYVTGNTTCLVNKFQNLLFSYCVALNDVDAIKGPTDCM